MAYSDINKMKIIYIIQEYYLEKRKLGIPVKRIWENVCAVYPMSIGTFYNYMSENVRAKLKESDIDLEKLNKTKDYVIETISTIEAAAYRHSECKAD